MLEMVGWRDAAGHDNSTTWEGWLIAVRRCSDVGQLVRSKGSRNIFGGTAFFTALQTPMRQYSIKLLKNTDQLYAYFVSVSSS